MSVAEAAGLGAVLALASRALSLVVHRGWFAQGFAGDSSIHWAIVRTLRRRPRAKWIDEYVISPEPMSYPTGFHRLAALFPLEVLRAHSWLPNLVLWVGGVAGFAAYIDYAARSLLHVAPTATVWLAVVLVLTVPSSVVYAGPAIAYLKLSERLLGRLASSFAVLLLVVGTLAHDLPSLAGAAGAVAVAVISSIFARQTLALGLPLLALAWWDWRPLAVLGAGAALGLLLSRTRFVHGLRHTWLQCAIVYPRLTKASAQMRAALSVLVTLPELLRAVRDHRELGRLLLFREPTRALAMYPELALLAVLLAVRQPADVWHWAAPLVVFALLYVLTSTQRFNHLGEAYRYLEYGLFFVVPLELALLVSSWPAWAQVLMVVVLAAWSAALAVGYLIYGNWLRFWPERDVLSDFLSGLELRPGDVVFPVTMSLGADICARVDRVRSFWWQPGIVATSIYDEFIEELPYLKREYWPLFEKYGVTHVVCDKAALTRIPWSYDFSELEPLVEDDLYSAFAVPSPAAMRRPVVEHEA